MKFLVPDMSCGHCKAAIEKAVAGIDPSASLHVDLDAHSVEIGSNLPAQSFVEALARAGYAAQPAP